MMLYNRQDRDAFTFGICLPSACSIEILQPAFNDHIQQIGNKFSVLLPQHTCQFEETPSKLNTLDRFAM